MDKNAKLIERSHVALELQIISSAIVAIICALLASQLIGVFFRLWDSSGVTIRLFIWAFFTVIWGIASLQMWIWWHKEYYEISSEAIILHKKKTFGAETKTLYRYDSIISVRLTKTFFGRHYNYGDVHLKIPKLDHEIIIKNISNPDKQLVDIQKSIEARSGQANLVI